MPFLAIIGKGALSLARRGFAFIGSLQPFQLISLALGLLSLFLGALLADARHDAAKWKGQTVALVAARKADQANILAASKQAEAQNKAQVAAVVKRQDQITKEVSDDYETQLAALRASNRLRRASQAHSGGADGNRASTASQTASGPDADGVQIPTDSTLQAEEIELRLMHLQNWAEHQAAVDPNTPH